MNKINVLDKGYVILRNISGPTRRPEEEFDADDIDPANSARMSFDQMDSGRTRDQDLRLCEFLMKNWHTTPFEMVQVWLQIRMPIMVARQLVRQRMQSINEISGRYVNLPADWYIPAIEDVVFQVKDKKQGGGAIDLSDPFQVAKAAAGQHVLNNQCEQSYKTYLFLKDECGWANEQARMALHLNHYTEWLSSSNLHNVFHMLETRDHSHAQGETQKYARAIDTLIRRVLPKSMELYDTYRKQP